MESREGEHLEFKEAKARFDFEELVKYCCALANERGGRIVLGVTDKRPRRVVGTAAFRTLERTTAGLVDRLHLTWRSRSLLTQTAAWSSSMCRADPSACPCSTRGPTGCVGAMDLFP